MNGAGMIKRSTLLAISSVLIIGAAPASPPLDLSNLVKIAEIDPRYQSYNVEMVEVTGGRFWAPYGGPPDEVYRMLPPADLADKRLVALTRALGPAYMRVSGTWANTTYLEAAGEQLSQPPDGYNQVLTRQQWRGAVAFAKAVNAEIGFSYAVGKGARDAAGVWQSAQAQRLLDLTREAGGRIAFSEFINEPNAASLGSLPSGYRVADYTRDFGLFRQWVQMAAPDMKIVGPGGVGEGGGLDNIPVANLERMLLTRELMKESPNSVDAVSYHFYGDVSQRCAKMRPKTADKAAALTPAWLDLTLRDWRYYSNLRDQYEPGDPMWITETAQAACGGSPWATTFLDSFRYANQLGLLAQKNVQVVFHNTLAASDYSLIDGHTLKPRPNYWAAYFWRKTIGERVLSSPISPSNDLRLYSHCLRGTKGGVALLALSIGGNDQILDLGKSKATIWHLTGRLDATDIKVNGAVPALNRAGKFVNVQGRAVKGRIVLTGHSIAFFAIPDARNRACQ
jgi:heparanase